MTPHLEVSATKRKNKSFGISIRGAGYSIDELRNLFQILRAYQEVNENVIVVFPVLPELEDPKFMAELERRLDNVKTTPWQKVKKRTRS